MAIPGSGRAMSGRDDAVRSLFDSHAHVISANAEAFPPAPPSGVLPAGVYENPIDADQLRTRMEEVGVVRALLVQRGSVYGFDNSYVLAAAAARPECFSAVCSIDGENPAAPAQVEDAVRAGAAGIRFMELVRDRGLGWLTSSHAQKACEVADAAGLPVCVHLFPWNRIAGLAAVTRLARAFPRMRIVLDHLTNIRAHDDEKDFGIDDALTSLREIETIAFKFTTIPLGAMARNGRDSAALLRRLAEMFGADRLMWGSDIGQSPGSYGEQVALAHAAVTRLTEVEAEAVLARTAAQIYQM